LRLLSFPTGPSLAGSCPTMREQILQDGDALAQLCADVGR
jgi:hypothetical protein